MYIYIKEYGSSFSAYTLLIDQVSISEPNFLINTSNNMHFLKFLFSQLTQP